MTIFDIGESARHAAIDAGIKVRQVAKVASSPLNSILATAATAQALDTSYRGGTSKREMTSRPQLPRRPLDISRL
jgi:hypothetical protein